VEYKSCGAFVAVVVSSEGVVVADSVNHVVA
jgi:hypothetical protein